MVTALTEVQQHPIVKLALSPRVVRSSDSAGDFATSDFKKWTDAINQNRGIVDKKGCAEASLRAARVIVAARKANEKTEQGQSFTIQEVDATELEGVGATGKETVHNEIILTSAPRKVISAMDNITKRGICG